MIQCLLEIDDAVSVIVIALNNNLKLEVEEEDEQKKHSDLMAGLKLRISIATCVHTAHGVKKSKK